MTEVCYKFHPDTGFDAGDVETAGLTDEQKCELAEMVRAGARFYWHRSGTEWERVERGNFDFALYIATGEHPQFIEHRPQKPTGPASN